MKRFCSLRTENRRRLRKMGGYCVKGKEQEKKCQETRESVRMKHNGKLPKEYEGTSLESCLYCASFMVSE